eukprot:COSAG02_NODE_25339_length_661_cov_1.281139_1_plen_200_part_10
MVAAPLDSYLLSVYSKAPIRLGSIEDLRVVTEGGVRMADIGGGQMGEVVVATSADVAAGSALEAGVYVVGTGDTGVAATFVTVGLLYGSIMAAAASQHRVAPEGYLPPGYTPPQEEVEAAKKFVHIDDSLKTPQFWCVLAQTWKLVPPVLVLVHTGSMHELELCTSIVRRGFLCLTYSLFLPQFAVQDALVSCLPQWHRW